MVLGLIVAIVTKPHRRVGDFVAGTYVIGKADVGKPIDAGPGIIPGRAVGAVGLIRRLRHHRVQRRRRRQRWSPPGAPGCDTDNAGRCADHRSADVGRAQVGTSAPQWDASATPGSRRRGPNTWLRYDDAAAQWRPLD